MVCVECIARASWRTKGIAPGRELQRRQPLKSIPGPGGVSSLLVLGGLKKTATASSTVRGFDTGDQLGLIIPLLLPPPRRLRIPYRTPIANPSRITLPAEKGFARRQVETKFSESRAGKNVSDRLRGAGRGRDGAQREDEASKRTTRPTASIHCVFPLPPSPIPCRESRCCTPRRYTCAQQEGRRARWNQPSFILGRAAGGGGCGFHQVLFAGIGDMMMELPMSSNLKEWAELTTLRERR